MTPVWVAQWAPEYPPIMIGVDDVEDGFWNVRLAPNPAAEKSLLSLHSPTALDAQVQINTLNGVRISQQYVSLARGANRVPIDVAVLIPGVYVVQLVTGVGIVRVKLVVN